MARVDYWNHNVHYQSVILRAVPPGCGAALEVGCGDGLLASRLAECCAEVTAIDRDARMIALARSRAEAAGPGLMTVVEADYLAYPLADASFDFACANTSLHHMDFAAALAAMARALRPGGRLAVIGLAAHGSVGDYLADGPGIPAHLVYRAVRGKGDPGAPIKDPEMTWAEVRATARRLLPGVRYRRHLLWRYSLLWSKPADPSASCRRLWGTPIRAPRVATTASVSLPADPRRPASRLPIYPARPRRCCLISHSPCRLDSLMSPQTSFQPGVPIS